MKTILITLLCALAIARVGTCAAVCGDTESAYINCSPGIYLKGFGGLNLTNEPTWRHATYRTSTGYAVGTALGYNFGPLSVEGEFAYRHNFVDRLTVDALNVRVSGDIHQYCGFGNVLLNFPMAYCFAPYAGVGIGYRHMKPGVNFDETPNPTVQGFIDSANEWGVYQAIGGLKFAIARHASLQVEYRYMSGWSNVRCRNHTVDLAATIQF